MSTGNRKKHIDWDAVEGIDDPSVPLRVVAERAGCSHPTVWQMRHARRKRRLVKAGPELLDAIDVARTALAELACPGVCTCGGKGVACVALDEVDRISIRALSPRAPAAQLVAEAKRKERT
jgi:hypothetical protein